MLAQVQRSRPYTTHVIPAWDKFMSRVEGLHDNRAVPNKRDRYLLDPGIIDRMPSSSGRYIKAIRDFAQQWFHDPEMRATFEERLKTNPALDGVNLRVGNPRGDKVNISVTTRKGFITVSFDLDKFVF